MSHYANLKKVDFVLQTGGKKKDLSSMLYTVHSTVCVQYSRVVVPDRQATYAGVIDSF